MIADDVATYLAANGIGTRGVDIFVNNTPEDRLKCVTVYDTGGTEPVQDYPVDNPTVQVMVRNGSDNLGHAVAKSLANKIQLLLNRKQNITIGDADVLFVKAIQEPANIGLDEKSRWQITCNYIFRIRSSDEAVVLPTLNGSIPTKAIGRPATFIYDISSYFNDVTTYSIYSVTSPKSLAYDWLKINSETGELYGDLPDIDDDENFTVTIKGSNAFGSINSSFVFSVQ